MSRPVRVRFAPSPTGFLHIGGMRSSLFNWLWAKHNNGVFVLRIEDTDRNRLVEGAVEQILDSHEALGLIPDEGPSKGGDFGPYLQSERLDIYREYAEKLLLSGSLYKCWCTPERLTKLREQAQASGIAFKYDRYCLEPSHRKSDSDPHVLRFRIPDEPSEVSWNDAVRGRLTFKTDELDDFVAIKADGYPTYHFANVVDDHLMEISHVLRADEWIPSTPKHLLLFGAFGWEPPVYAHLPAVLGPGGNKKLSKRDGAEPVRTYIDQGYLPEALNSFLATLGWNDGTTQEIYEPAELIERFTLDRIQKSPAKFDKDHLLWVNGVFIRRMPLGELAKRADPFWPIEAAATAGVYKERVLALVQERLKFLAELPELTEFFFTDPTPPSELLTKSVDASTGAKALDKVLTALSDLEWTEDALEAAVRPPTDELGLSSGQLFGLLRVTLTGRAASPGLFETMFVLGHDSTRRRIERVAKQLSR